MGAVPEVVGDTGLPVGGISSQAIVSAVLRYLDCDVLRGGMGHRARMTTEAFFAISRRRREQDKLISDTLGRH